LRKYIPTSQIIPCSYNMISFHYYKVSHLFCICFLWYWGLNPRQTLYHFSHGSTLRYHICN
jgi:hypothetical protein